jgi:hypothetical protein
MILFIGISAALGISGFWWALGRAQLAESRLRAIARLEVHGREFVDATDLYKILGQSIPGPTDHAANIHTRAGQPPYRSPYT